MIFTKKGLNFPVFNPCGIRYGYYISEILQISDFMSYDIYLFIFIHFLGCLSGVLHRFIAIIATIKYADYYVLCRGGCEVLGMYHERMRGVNRDEKKLLAIRMHV